MLKFRLPVVNYNCSESRFIELNIDAYFKGYSDVKHGSLQTGSKEHAQTETACKHMFRQSKHPKPVLLYAGTVFVDHDRKHPFQHDVRKNSTEKS